jgi:hypothetical protein
MPSFKKFDSQNLKLDYSEFQNRYRKRKRKKKFTIFFQIKSLYLKSPRSERKSTTW